MTVKIDKNLKNKLNEILNIEDDLTEEELTLLIDTIDSSIDYEDLSIPEIYESDYGFGFFGCESDDYETAFEAKFSAILYAIINY